MKELELSLPDEGGGTLRYEEVEPGGIVNYEVETESDKMASLLDWYLSKERGFKIPESNEEDDYRTDVSIPTDGLTYFELSLNTLYAETGIRVNW